MYLPTTLIRQWYFWTGQSKLTFENLVIGEFQMFIKAQIEIWEILVHFKDSTAENVSLKSIQIRRETQKILTSRNLMQVRLSANQNVRTIEVITAAFYVRSQWLFL